MIGEDIVLTVVDVRNDTVRLGIAAPRSVAVNRAEVRQAVAEANQDSVRSDDSALESLRGLRPRPGSGGPEH